MEVGSHLFFLFECVLELVRRIPQLTEEFAEKIKPKSY